MIKIAGKMFIQYEKEMDEPNQTIKRFKDYIADDKIKKVVLNKVFENNLEENVKSENDQIYEKISANNFNKLI